MKNLAIILSAISWMQLSYAYAQECTPPDTAAIRKNHVKEISIEFVNEKGTAYPNHTYRYDKNGRMVYSAEGNPSYYYSFRYDSSGRMCWSDQRKMDGKLIAGYEFGFYPDGTRSRFATYNEHDTIHPREITLYDISGNITSHTYYSQGKFITALLYTYDGNTETTVTDSSEYTSLTRANDRVIRFHDVDTLLHPEETWYLFYDSTGLIHHTICYHSGKRDSTFVHLLSGGKYELVLNGRIPDLSEDKAWRDKWDYLIPKKMWPQDRLPIADPVPEETWNHILTRDKKGNITKDVITPGASWMRNETVTYTYAYKYW